MWGGTAIKASPAKFQLKDTLIKLPPLNQKPIFPAEKGGRMSISEATMPKLNAMKETKAQIKDARTKTHSTDNKPNTAQAHLMSLDRISEISSTKHNMRRSMGGNRNSAVVAATQQSSPSEFNMQLSKIREKEDEVKRAIETSQMLLAFQSSGMASSHRLKEISTNSRLPMENASGQDST